MKVLSALVVIGIFIGLWILGSDRHWSGERFEDLGDSRSKLELLMSEPSGYNLVESFNADIDAAIRSDNSGYVDLAEEASRMALCMRVEDLLYSSVVDVYVHDGESYDDMVEAWEFANAEAAKNLEEYEANGRERLAQIARIHSRNLVRINEFHIMLWED
jgi:hypothetical protein